MAESYSREYVQLLIQERARLRNVLQEIHALATTTTTNHVVICGQVAATARAALTSSPLWDDWAG